MATTEVNISVFFLKKVLKHFRKKEKKRKGSKVSKHFYTKP